MDHLLKKIFLIGIGMGTEHGLTVEAKQFIDKSDLVIGADRMLSLPFLKKKAKLKAYKPVEIGTFLRQHPEYESPCILVSGDVGFYSGAKKIIKELTDYEVVLIPGISSLLYFCSKLQMPWEDMDLVSLHGRKENLISHIKRKKTTFAILSGAEDLYDLCDKINLYKIKDITLHIGENLSYQNERIIHIRPHELKDFDFGRLLSVVVENPNPDTRTYMEISDSEFIRENVPMTKCEVRTVSIGKLRMNQDSVLYDIGAGTGSISIQAAINYPDSRVYAIEKNPMAVALIRENKVRFAADNLTVMEGLAPDCLHELPVPTHVFIGGSTGNMSRIIDCVWDKNPGARIVINAITLETVAEVMDILKQKKIESADIIQMAVSKAKEIGSYHLMMGQNPVTIITIS